MFIFKQCLTKKDPDLEELFQALKNLPLNVSKMSTHLVVQRGFLFFDARLIIRALSFSEFWVTAHIDKGNAVFEGIFGYHELLLLARIVFSELGIPRSSSLSSVLVEIHRSL